MVVAFVLISARNIQSSEERFPIITLRTSHKDISLWLLIVPQNRIFSIRSANTENDGHYIYCKINHDYKKKSINGDCVVIDNATGLMWHQSGSDEKIKWTQAWHWLADLNNGGYAGYKDWRLPTVDEAASLLESYENADSSYINPIFNEKQYAIWTGDTNKEMGYGSGAAYHVYFGQGYVAWITLDSADYVRPVRSIK